MNKVAIAFFSVFVSCASPMALAQSGGGAAPFGGGNNETEEGIPVTDKLVIDSCSGCHARDEKGNMSRISWARSTPEGWSEALKRMVRANGLTVSADEARAIVKSLSASHGLAPEEAKPVMYMAERRMVVETNIPNDNVRDACTRCHAFGKAMSWRRSKNDWQLLQNLHVALYAQGEAAFVRNPPRGAAAADAKPQQQPGEAALEFLSKSAGLHTPEWAAWKARQRAPRVTGTWLVTASMPGQGRYVGEMTIEQGPKDDEFKTSVTLKSLKNGSTLTRSGTGIIYAGYSWRGRSSGANAASAKADDVGNEARETLWIAPDQSSAEGRWYWGAYQEFGFDVKMQRATASPVVSAVDVHSLRTGTKGAQVKVYGYNLPSGMTAADIDMGAGVKVNRIVSQNAKEVVAVVDVDAAAVSGKRDVAVKHTTLENAFTVYDKVDYIAVTPDTALARLGGGVAVKGYQQFEAIGFLNGGDGKPNTADDIAVGPRDVTWSVQEFMAVYNDDDKDFVGELNSNALFTPASDGPNPDRKFGRNNYGDIWVVATSKEDKNDSGEGLSGRAYLVVTVPLYLRWDNPEVSQ
jgi:quinohemoprotein amine dehydrogenase